MARAEVNGAAGTDGDWSSTKMVAPIGIGACNCPSAGFGAGGAAVAGVGETGAEGVDNCAGAVEAGSAPVRPVTAGGTAEVAEEYTREKAMRIRIPVVYDGVPPRDFEEG